LRIDPGAKIDSSRGKNVGASTSFTSECHLNHTAQRAAFLSKICDFKKAMVGGCDCQGRSRNDFALESPRKEQASVQEAKNNQTSTQMHFHFSSYTRDYCISQF